MKIDNFFAELKRRNIIGRVDRKPAFWESGV
jgi:hypothetical protein